MCSSSAAVTRPRLRQSSARGFFCSPISIPPGGTSRSLGGSAAVSIRSSTGDEGVSQVLIRVGPTLPETAPWRKCALVVSAFYTSSTGEEINTCETPSQWSAKICLKTFQSHEEAAIIGSHRVGVIRLLRWSGGTTLPPRRPPLIRPSLRYPHPTRLSLMKESFRDRKNAFSYTMDIHENKTAREIRRAATAELAA